MFKIAVNHLVESIGDDFYLPSPSTASTKNLTPLSLVERKTSRFGNINSYHAADFMLQDIVLHHNLAKVEVSPDLKFCTFNRESNMKVKQVIEGHLKGIFGAKVKHVDTVTMLAEMGDLTITEVNLQSLLRTLQHIKLNMYHELVRELSSRKRRALCVVTGVIKTSAPCSIRAKLCHKFKAGTKVDNLRVGGVEAGCEMSGSQENSSKRALLLPEGTVLAFQVVELAISDEGIVRAMVSHGSKGGFHASLRDTQSSIAAVAVEALALGRKPKQNPKWSFSPQKCKNDGNKYDRSLSAAGRLYRTFSSS